MHQHISLDDKYDLTKNRVYLTGAQAIVRMMMMQHEADKAAGLNTAGFISGYRGSPLGGLDGQFEKARKHFDAHNITFIPGLNEELAATAVWGSQQAELGGHGKYDGVFSLWYGKGPGVDRSGDVFRHGNLAGTSPHGGAIVLMGDDHTAESSTNAHQTEFNFVDYMMPILNPAGVQELIDYGLLGYALSRYSSTWVALKCVKDNVESTASVNAGLNRLDIQLPPFDGPEGGLHIRPNDIDFLGQEVRLNEYKRLAANLFIRANNINRTIWSGGPNAKLGIISTGKSYLDVLQAFSNLGIGEAEANAMGIRLFKVGCTWPFDYEDVKAFSEGLAEIIVVEEKRSLIETQIREALYGTANQPVVVGKKDERGEWLFHVKGALDPNDIAIAVGERITKFIGAHAEVEARTARLKQAQAMIAGINDVGNRVPYFCSGCPHNTSTRVPEGSVAGAGIGCHFMAVWMDRDTVGFTQMGGEGAQWVGQAPFSDRNHIFQNLGDGTYSHSGSLAIRFALSAGTNITYKILFNDAVAMTGGQRVDSGASVDQIARQVAAEGVKRIALVTDEPDKYPAGIDWPKGMTIHHRRELDDVQRTLRDIPGVTVLIYDQTCAAEKRRRRKRGTFPDPDKRVFINEAVCEGCGDCGKKSNCVSIQPVETAFGRKRKIDQSSCNKDFSCLEGFCPSFVTVHGAKLRKAEAKVTDASGFDAMYESLAPAKLASLDNGWAAIITGIGGTGVVTIGQILGMAAHIEEKGCGLIDMAGLAQKGGAVATHMRIAKTPEDISAIRVPAGGSNLILGCDLAVSATKKVLSTVTEDHTLFIANTAEIMPGSFTQNPDFSFPAELMKKTIRKAAGEGKTRFFDADEAARQLFGNALAANMFMLGFASQLGGLPVTPASIEEAIALNGQAIDMNISAFRWGRVAAENPDKVLDLYREHIHAHAVTETVDDVIARYRDLLTAYQNASYARRFEHAIAQIGKREADVSGDAGPVTRAAAKSLGKLMAYKDEYEAARLFTNGDFMHELSEQFSSWDKLEFHMAPPVFAKKDKHGHLQKSSYGPWMLKAMGALAKFRFLRGTALDIFGRSEERQMERQLIADFEALLTRIAPAMTAENIGAVTELLELPQKIRGYGHVKEKAEKEVRAKMAALEATIFDPAGTPVHREAAE
ncbi:indolepyruvate ferredoxin oxidoreductase family protein [Rhizobium sp. L1K21]|uniref:indolepyruvate ferredoxin oxidoreductase family protein n=1 Tax=Rhizobium sp. L1K21 TaxID=2954933 RepID=UPI0020930B66|nr:indolepyruvate ferredoxin oxidoreductase family protein [Rhizobium sp. L1K21]MCO6186766.1 indolepyruvate ferredoxin oxidoreductase family protein [Rhizobium sp. L1K21]